MRHAFARQYRFPLNFLELFRDAAFYRLNVLLAVYAVIPRDFVTILPLFTLVSVKEKRNKKGPVETILRINRSISN